MTTRRKKTDDVQDEETISLAEILQGDSDSGGPYYGIVDSNTCLRLIHSATAVGSFITFWRDSTNQRICFSVRLGTQKRSYQVEEAEEFVQVAESVIGRLAPVLIARKKPAPPPIK